MRYLRDTILATASAASTRTSALIDARNLLQGSIQAVATGSIVGTLTVQMSNDFIQPAVPESTVPTNWSDIFSLSVAISSAGVYNIPKFDICYEYLRVVYTAVSGTGNLTVNLKALGC